MTTVDDANWELWCSDTFSRGAMKDAAGSVLLEGLALLWKKSANEAITADGRGTFSRFSVVWGRHTAGETVHVSVDSTGPNPGLLRIRTWLETDGALTKDLAAAHLRLVGEMRDGVASVNMYKEAREIERRALAATDLADFRRLLATQEEP